jgi:hypothetical protein
LAAAVLIKDFTTAPLSRVEADGALLPRKAQKNQCGRAATQANAAKKRRKHKKAKFLLGFPFALATGASALLCPLFFATFAPFHGKIFPTRKGIEPFTKLGAENTAKVILASGR